MKINRTELLELQEDEYFVVEFEYDFEEDEADIQFRREMHVNVIIVDEIRNESCESEDDFEIQEYYFYTRDKNRLKTID